MTEQLTHTHRLGNGSLERLFATFAQIVSPMDRIWLQICENPKSISSRWLLDDNWVWVNSGSWWWTGRPGVLRFMGSQRVRQDWVTELNWRPRASSSASRRHVDWQLVAGEGLCAPGEPTVGEVGCPACRLATWSSWRVCPCYLGPDKTCFTGAGNGKPLQYSCLENLMNTMKRQKDMTLEDKPSRWVGVQYTWGVLGEKWRGEVEKQLQKEWRAWAQVETSLSCGCVWWWK